MHGTVRMGRARDGGAQNRVVYRLRVLNRLSRGLLNKRLGNFQQNVGPNERFVQSFHQGNRLAQLIDQPQEASNFPCRFRCGLLLMMLELYAQFRYQASVVLARIASLGCDGPGHGYPKLFDRPGRACEFWPLQSRSIPSKLLQHPLQIQESLSLNFRGRGELPLKEPPLQIIFPPLTEPIALGPQDPLQSAGLDTQATSQNGDLPIRNRPVVTTRGPDPLRKFLRVEGCRGGNGFFGPRRGKNAFFKQILPFSTDRKQQKSKNRGASNLSKHDGRSSWGNAANLSAHST